MNEHITQKIIASIPSAIMRDYLSEHMPQWTIMQAATIICESGKKRRHKADILSELSTMTDNEYEQALLRTAVNDIIKKGYVDEATHKIYSSHRTSPNEPKYPFIEICNLPVLFHPGDVIYCKSGYAFVESEPYLPDGRSDFSDECYLTILLSCKDPLNEDEHFISHEHIPLLEADYASEKDLTDTQRNNLKLLRKQFQYM